MPEKTHAELLGCHSKSKSCHCSLAWILLNSSDNLDSLTGLWWDCCKNNKKNHAGHCYLDSESMQTCCVLLKVNKR